MNSAWLLPNGNIVIPSGGFIDGVEYDGAEEIGHGDPRYERYRQGAIDVASLSAEELAIRGIDRYLRDKDA